MSDNDDNQGGGFFNNPTRRVGGGPAPTLKKGATPAPAASPAGSGAHADDQRTRLHRPGGSAHDNAGQTTPAAGGAHAHAPEFVVGWVVVTAGPGRGASRALGYGMNNIGRGAEAQVSLDFGDSEISRAHCQIAYDNRNRKFYVTHGGGQNLTYLSEQPVLSPIELQAGDLISLGNTTLKFIPLCGTEFEWADPAAATDQPG